MALIEPIPRIGKIFQETPRHVREAWDRFRPMHEAPEAVIGAAYFDTRRALKEACARAGTYGFFALDGYLVGWSHPFGGRRFTIAPASLPINKEGRTC